MTWTIRSAVEADLPGIGEVFRRASLSNEHDRDNLLAHPELLEFDGEDRLEHCTRVAESDGAVIGFITVDGAEVDDLFVDPDWRRRGVARDLMQNEVLRARAAGVPRLEVTANPHALAFYAEVGFRTVGEAETRFGPVPRMQLEL